MPEFAADSSVALLVERPVEGGAPELRVELPDRPCRVGPKQPIGIPEVADHDRLELRRSIVARRDQGIAPKDSRPPSWEVEVTEP
jgi:hypothetical protein